MPSQPPNRSNNALVVHNPNQGRRPRPDNRRRAGGPRRPNPQWQEQDDVSAVSDADYEEDYEEPRFKYSTAELRNASCIRNQKCCIASMIILCLIVAIVISLVVQKFMKDLEEDANKVPTDPPTIAPSISPAPSLSPSVTAGRFLRHALEEW
ncbi:unnamed protein product [Cylindrotheca closterium]|uniref:Uncharacterized protein n=1 Tax=Cylindrotheca closterium TaxID=2856 RepID=A0AAD2GCE8_9STRA|nr:unnamed protein product [Cylindrotheca closterium]